jgi:hypothetical protein
MSDECRVKRRRWQAKKKAYGRLVWCVFELFLLMLSVVMLDGVGIDVCDGEKGLYVCVCVLCAIDVTICKAARRDK